MDDELGQLARKQWGVFSRAQAIAAGISRWAIARKLARGTWVKVEPAVYRYQGGYDSWHQRVCAATLAVPGAMASHRTAAFLWSIEGLGGAPALIEVTADQNISQHVLLARVHHTRRLPSEPELRDEIATTPLARTLLDLAEVVSEEKLFIAVDSAQRKFGSLLPALGKELAGVGRGRRKRKMFAKMMKLAKGAQPTDSPLEAKAALAMERFGLPRPTRQYEVRDANRKLIARVDFAWVEHRVILQCESNEWHLAPEQFEKDLRQRRQLESYGWRVVHVTWKMLASRDWLLDVERLLTAQSPAAPVH